MNQQFFRRAFLIDSCSIESHRTEHEMRTICLLGLALVALWFQACSTAPVRSREAASSDRDDVQVIIDSIVNDRRTWVDPARLFKEERGDATGLGLLSGDAAGNELTN